MMRAAQRFVAGVQAIEGIEVVGEPEMTVVAFRASRRQARVASQRPWPQLCPLGSHLPACARLSARSSLARCRFDLSTPYTHNTLTAHSQHKRLPCLAAGRSTSTK